MLYDPAELLAAQGLLQPGKALLLAQVRRIEHLHTLSPTKSIDIVSLVVRSLRSLSRQEVEEAERYLTELLAVLVAEHLELNLALGLELTVRDDAHKVHTLATQILLGEADSYTSEDAPDQSQIEISLDETTRRLNTEEEI